MEVDTLIYTWPSPGEKFYMIYGYLENVSTSVKKIYLKKSFYLGMLADSTPLFETYLSHFELKSFGGCLKILFLFFLPNKLCKTPIHFCCNDVWKLTTF